MTKYVLRRVLMLVPTLVGMSILIFIMVRIMPGDIVDTMTGFDPQMNEEQRAAMRHGYGLDRPIYVQYLDWIGRIVRGDLGQSFRTFEPITDQLVRSLPVTLELAFLAITLSLLVAIPLAVISAVNRNSITDLAATVGGLIGLSFPSFWLATMFLLMTSLWLHWTPPLVWISPLDDFFGNLKQMFLPALSIGVTLMATEMRMARTAILEILRQDYIRTAHAKGLSNRRVLYRHALRNALIPVVTVVGLQVGHLIGGSIIIEQIFGLPGVGWLMLQGVYSRDYPVVQVTALFMATIFVSMNLLVDIMYAFLDPRIRYR